MSDVDIPKGGQALRLTLCPEMTLRDLFAAAALPAIVSGWYAGKHVGTSLGDHEGIADCAYLMADAMLAQRAKVRRDAE